MSVEIKTIAVIGAGAWGTALAQVCAQKDLDVTLWVHDRDIATNINKTRINETYLPDIALHENLKVTDDLKSAFGCDLLIIAVPTQHVAEVLEKGVGFIRKNAIVLIASKGIEISTTRLLSQVVAAIVPNHPVGVLTGPSFAIEVARGLPAALTVAFADPYQDIAYQLCETLSNLHFRLYASDDPIGAQIGGAIKNVIAIACGIAHGKAMGDNARAAILTRGLSEMVRLGSALGADPQTFLGLSGVGDLTLTCNAMQSRNFSLGVAIGQGQRAADILASRSTVAEGYYTAEAAVKLARALDIDMPICQAVYETLHKEKAIDYVIKGLLERPIRVE